LIAGLLAAVTGARAPAARFQQQAPLLAPAHLDLMSIVDEMHRPEELKPHISEVIWR